MENSLIHLEWEHGRTRADLDAVARRKISLL
jgi:hypothetical protein